MNDLLQNLNIYLIGMMGSGKTTVGKLLSQQLSYRFFDTDILIEKVAQKSINNLFAENGEAFFRDLESQILGELSACTRSVIATGGGIILRPLNWSYLRHGLIIWLDAPIPLLVERLAKDDTRPLLQTDSLFLTLEALLTERKSLYQEADLHISIEAGETPEAIASKILERIPTILKSPPKTISSDSDISDNLHSVN